ncbi:uncharacterized protein LOC128727162 [Anopheles nili]|uniref:uncharacterized protein LOC128727162 n=1 Tax=Anopheles nili TaxID=185578 RepID=UPI00237BA471|nr:uncharacterized protein LOC128727162 [Anopheles nili]
MEAELYFRSFFDFYCQHQIDSENKIKPFKINPYRHKLFVVKSILIMITCIWLGMYGKRFENDFIPNRSCINRMINWLCIGATFATSFVVTWESLAASREDVQVWNTFNSIENYFDFNDCEVRKQFLKSRRAYSITFYTLITGMCAVGVILTIEYKFRDRALIEFILIFAILSIVDIFRMLHIALYVRILTTYLKLIMNDISKIAVNVNVSDAYSETCNEKLQKKQLHRLSTCYLLCMKAFKQIQDQFAWGLFIVCLKYSIVLWNDIYWTVYRAIMETSFEWFCLNVVPYHFVFLSFTSTCEGLYSEVKTMSQLLYTFDLNKTATCVKVWIVQLLLLLEYKVFFFHMFGVCRISYNLVLQYMLAGATRVSFIAQILIDFYWEMK